MHSMLALNSLPSCLSPRILHCILHEIVRFMVEKETWTAQCFLKCNKAKRIKTKEKKKNKIPPRQKQTKKKDVDILNFIK